MQRLVRRTIRSRGMKTVARAWDSYSRALDTNPFVTKSITAGIIGMAGDLLCQNLQQPGSMSLERLGRFGLVATFFAGPTLHVWYTYLGKLIPGTQFSAVAKRIALDAFAFTPVYTPVVMGMLMYLQNPKSDITARLKRELPSTLAACWAVWIPVQYVNFGYVPIKYQVLFVNTFGVVWNCFISFITNK